MDAPSLLPPAPRHTLPGGRGHRGRTPGDRKMVNVGRYHSKVFTNLKYHILLHLQAVSLKSNSYQRTTVDHIRPRPRRPEQDMMRYRKRPLADAVRGDAFGDTRLGRFQPQTTWSHSCLLRPPRDARQAALRPTRPAAACAHRSRRVSGTGSNSSVMQPHPYVTVPFT